MAGVPKRLDSIQIFFLYTYGKKWQATVSNLYQQVLFDVFSFLNVVIFEAVRRISVSKKKNSHINHITGGFARRSHENI